MSKKIRWEDVCNDFKRRHPTLAKNIIHFEPHGYATILLIFSDRTKMLYDYDTKIAKIISNC